MIIVHASLLLLVVGSPMINAFATVPNIIPQTTTSLINLSSLFSPQDHSDDAKNHDTFISRRAIFRAVSRIGTLMLLGSGSLPFSANAAPLSDEPTVIAMKTFVDPEGMFVINIPQRFFAIRRTNQGDLPNAATGSGRRGSSIFNAGDLAKAEVLAIERYVIWFQK